MADALHTRFTMPHTWHTIPIALQMNGQLWRGEVRAGETLLEFVRERFRLTGTKRSCEFQVCGACTILVDGEPISACTYLAFEASGKGVTTIEGLAPEGHLDPLQEAFIQRGATQCGFCTSGMLLACKALLQAYPIGHQPQDRSGARSDHPASAPLPGRRGAPLSRDTWCPHRDSCCRGNGSHPWSRCAKIPITVTRGERSTIRRCGFPRVMTPPRDVRRPPGRSALTPGPLGIRGVPPGHRRPGTTGPRPQAADRGRLR
jgi:aerobic-type carbon monoxide dehydrogenase small subunit (CoxS/CutS family)